MRVKHETSMSPLGRKDASPASLKNDDDQKCICPHQAHIDTLSPELLVMIFKFVLRWIDKGGFQRSDHSHRMLCPLSLGAVCRRWCMIALDTPALWTVIEWQPRKTRREYSEEMQESFLGRSQHAPPYGAAWIDEEGGVDPSVARHAHRIRNFFIGDRSERTPTLDFDLPVLEQLTIEGPPFVGDATFVTRVAVALGVPLPIPARSSRSATPATRSKLVLPWTEPPHAGLALLADCLREARAGRLASLRVVLKVSGRPREDAGMVAAAKVLCKVVGGDSEASEPGARAPLGLKELEMRVQDTGVLGQMDLAARAAGIERIVIHCPYPEDGRVGRVGRKLPQRELDKAMDGMHWW
ncbi:uncharacterized protein BXZ73DRAFT_108519 [Epithele typhae]|uniref:uncharacterized protein n=1 Tax=Epithele typhae TaxID=378194 RepID=UPI0020072148|nr:uncharacterized protein BXZ73DRAFT_108519 [Epithele typhae]KAH9910784.1 hypothetical protein BXZ73DRAFT_108519 [Epithele typhae]